MIEFKDGSFVSVARYLQEDTADENLDGLKVHDHKAGTVRLVGSSWLALSAGRAP